MATPANDPFAPVPVHVVEVVFMATFPIPVEADHCGATPFEALSPQPEAVMGLLFKL
jgi:hypothetical protein